MAERMLHLPERLSRELGEVEAGTIIELIELGLKQKRIEQALAELARGEMSLGAAAQMAGLREDEMARHARAQGLEPPADPLALKEELA